MALMIHADDRLKAAALSLLEKNSPQPLSISAEGFMLVSLPTTRAFAITYKGFAGIFGINEKNEIDRDWIALDDGKEKKRIFGKK